MPRIEHHLDEDGTEYKWCGKCKSYNLLDNFLACTTTWDGLRPTCQDCLKKQRVGNKERMTEYNKKCWQKTKVEQSAKNKIWRESNVEHRLWITYLSE